MRNILHEYYRPTKEQLKGFWKSSLITFDASSLLNLYGYSTSTKDELVKIYGGLKDRVFLPYQFALEFSRNRAGVIKNQISNFDKAIKDLNELRKKHQVRQEQPYLSQASLKTVDGVLAELSEGKSKLEKSISSDAVSDILLDVFHGRIGTPPSKEELNAFYDEGRSRYKALIPPGFADLKDKGEPDCYGDYIAWKQIMSASMREKRDVILVTDDMKDDWWHYESSRLVGPLPALRKEFQDTTKQLVWLYNTEGFLRATREFLDITVAEEALTEVNAALETQLIDRTERSHKSKPAGSEAAALPIKPTYSKEKAVDTDPGLKKKGAPTDEIEAETGEN